MGDVGVTFVAQGSDKSEPFDQGGGSLGAYPNVAFIIE
jgi:hypothetical protein